jgi:sugar lactone lactonase YvrE
MRIAAFFSAGALLAGCASGAGQSGAMPALPDSAAQPTRAALLFTGGPNANDVDVYREFQNDPQPGRHITAALDAPTGMAVDAAGNLFVCNNAGQTVPGKSVFWTVTVYHPGAGMPFRTYTDGIFSPVDVALAGDGTAYVANYSSEVTVYPAGSLQPSKTLRAPAGDAPIGVALDVSGDVFVSYVPRSGSGGRIYEYQAGRVRGHDLGIAFNASPHGLAIDARGDLIVAVSNAPGSGSNVEVFAPRARHPKKTLTGPFQPFMLALSRDQRRLFVADYGSGNNDGAIFVYAYPSGHLLYKDVHGAAAGAYGVAVSG